MVDYNAPLYQHPQAEWDQKKCERLAKRIARDGMGTKYHFRGYIHPGEIGHIGGIRYNGGTVIDDEWWQGEEHQLPKLPDGFKFIYVSTWGWRLIKTPACESKPIPDLTHASMG